ncbi:MAG: glycosyltransferase, partial [Cyanobacteria bacterium J06636_27]
STLHGGIPELVEDGVSGYLVPERDVDALSQRLGDLLSDTQSWEAMSKAGRAFVEQHYEINSLNDRLVELYLSLNHG